ncbi:MAG: Na+/H+ antiporter subunit E [Defluviitaleaceae bacterium]|nr:Na+/H+ antiporter subunit E [Defluviitaleaceae bacterium]
MPVLFLAFWIILNSAVTPEVLVIGVLISVVMSLFLYKMVGLSFAKEKQIWAKAWPITIYMSMLLWEIVKANIQMIKIILSPKLEIHPQIVYFQSPVKSDFAKVMLTYSIMLTPGTVIFELNGDRFGIHAIDPTMTDTINDSIFVRMLQDKLDDTTEGGQ